ncbi:MAG: hypothetical protein SGCHY_000851, partial [Lobulomycetales sp.]
MSMTEEVVVDGTPVSEYHKEFQHGEVTHVRDPSIAQMANNPIKLSTPDWAPWL